MLPVCRIVVDRFERESGVPDALEAQGVAIELQPLRVGDYELGSGVIVERKTVADLHLSLERGRLWRQIGELREAARLPYLLVEGCDLDRGSLRPTAIRAACLAVIGQGVPLVNDVFEFPDLLGAAYEYLIKEFADSGIKLELGV